eukprot:6798482-Ditylum_brightwellii.AAC.1
MVHAKGAAKEAVVLWWGAKRSRPLRDLGQVPAAGRFIAHAIAVLEDVHNHLEGHSLQYAVTVKLEACLGVGDGVE